MISDQVPVTLKLIAVLESLEIEYLIGGSFASSLFGEYRSTQDIDMVIDISHKHISSLEHALKDEFYIDTEMISEAIKYQISFNILHIETMIKIDLFPKKKGFWVDEEWKRRKKLHIFSDEDSPEVNFASAEDTILQKLQWYQMGNQISEQQWRDVLGVLKVQGDALEFDYLHKWAVDIGVSELLNKAIHESKL